MLTIELADRDEPLPLTWFVLYCSLSALSTESRESELHVVKTKTVLHVTDSMYL